MKARVEARIAVHTTYGLAASVATKGSPAFRTNVDARSPPRTPPILSQRPDPGRWAVIAPHERDARPAAPQDGQAEARQRQFHARGFVVIRCGQWSSAITAGSID